MSLSSQASARVGSSASSISRRLDRDPAHRAAQLVVLRGAERFNRIIGETGMIALTRLTGFLMVCIGAQFIINGLTMILTDPVLWAGLAEAIRQGGTGS